MILRILVFQENIILNVRCVLYKHQKKFQPLVFHKNAWLGCEMCFIETPYDTSYIGVSGKHNSECKMCFIETPDDTLPFGVSGKHQSEC